MWLPCSDALWGSTIKRIRVNCTDAYSGVNSVSFNLTNIPDSYTHIYSANATSVSGDWWIYDNTDLTIYDSGDWNFTTTCTDGASRTDSSYVDWSVAWGHLEPYLISPYVENGNTNVNHNEFFQFKSGVQCVGGECGDINATLDPHRIKNKFTENDGKIIVNNITLKPEKVRPGDVMNIYVQIENKYGVKSVKIKMPYEGGSDLLELNLHNGTKYNGWWHGQWVVHDTAVKHYMSDVLVKDYSGQQLRVNAGWADALFTTTATVDIKYPSGSLAVDNGAMSCGSTSCSGSSGETTCTYNYNDCSQEGDYKATATFTFSGDNCEDDSIATGPDNLAPSGQTAGDCTGPTDCAVDPQNLNDATAETVIYNINWDNDQNDCSCKGGTWLSSATYCGSLGCSGGKCCGDDSGEDFEQTEGSGRSCCFNGDELSSDSTSGTDGSILCYDGQFYDCNNATSDTDAIETIKETNDELGSYRCYSNNTWVLSSTGLKGGAISTTPGDTPFYTNSSNPMNGTDYACLNNMKAGDTCNQIWYVNATGSVGTMWRFFTIYEPTTYSAYLSQNETGKTNITIVTPPTITSVNATNANGTLSNATYPTNVGQNVTFNVDWYSESGYQARIYICSSNSVTSSGCTDTTLCSTTNAATDPVSCNYTTQESDSTTNTVYAFVCDQIDSCSSGSPVSYDVNHKPAVASASISPDPAYTDSTLTCNNGTVSDSDGDTVSLSYKWYKNNTIISGETSQTLGSGNFSKGDKMKCEITPTDQHGFAGEAVNSTELTISNAAPTLTSISANLTCVKQGTSVTITTSGASDADNDGLILRVGQSSGSYDLCNSTSGQPERSCSFNSPWSDTTSHTIYGIVDDGTATSPEKTTSINSDNSGPNAPTGLSPDGTCDSDQTPTLSWSAPSDVGCSSVSEYNVTLYSNSDCTGILQTYTTSSTSQDLTTLSTGTYYWKVRAVS